VGEPDSRAKRANQKATLTTLKENLGKENALRERPNSPKRAIGEFSLPGLFVSPAGQIEQTFRPMIDSRGSSSPSIL
jgi:hypothetical protein